MRFIFLILFLSFVGCSKSVEMSDTNLNINTVPITTSNNGSFSLNFSNFADPESTPVYSAWPFSESLNLQIPSLITQFSTSQSENLELYKNNWLIASYSKVLNKYVKVSGVNTISVQPNDTFVLRGVMAGNTVSIQILYSK